MSDMQRNYLHGEAYPEQRPAYWQAIDSFLAAKTIAPKPFVIRHVSRVTTERRMAFLVDVDPKIGAPGQKNSSGKIHPQATFVQRCRRDVHHA